MKKMRILILLMSLSGLAPALLGGFAWGVENRGKNGMKQECDLKEAKELRTSLEGKASKDILKGGKKGI